MKKSNNNEIEKKEEKVLAVGINLSLLTTLAAFLEYGITDTYNFKKSDISNLIVVMRRMICATKNEYDELECMLES